MLNPFTKLKLTTLLIVFLFFSCFGSSAGYPGTEELVIRAVQKVEPVVVNVKTIWVSARTGRVKSGMGSGVIIKRSGWIITNAHVTRNANKIFVTLNDGRVFKVKEWRACPEEDIAVLKITAQKLPIASIGNSSYLKKGQLAIAIGNPWRFDSTVTVGCISATGRRLEAGRVVLRDMIQTDAAINPGNSGGALANSKGQVIGINSIVYTGAGSEYAQGLGFAIPINHAMKIARILISRKKSSQKPWLGITIQNVYPTMKFSVKYGVIITGFLPYSPARKTGLKVGDIITSLNQVPIKNAEDLQKVLFNYKPGETITLIVIRKGQKYRGIIKLEGMRQ